MGPRICVALGPDGGVSGDWGARLRWFFRGVGVGASGARVPEHPRNGPSERLLQRTVLSTHSTPFWGVWRVRSSRSEVQVSIVVRGLHWERGAVRGCVWAWLHFVWQ